MKYDAKCKCGEIYHVYEDQKVTCLECGAVITHDPITNNQALVAESPAGMTVYLSPDLEHHAEEYECAMMVLDDMNIPREDKGGNAYSLVGRIKLAIEMAKER